MSLISKNIVKNYLKLFQVHYLKAFIREISIGDKDLKLNHASYSEFCPKRCF